VDDVNSEKRRARSDAQRNRQRLLDAAVRVLAGSGADVAPQAIAKEAGVGVGTLYRHFPTREALIDAAYRSDLSRLCGAVPDLLAEHRAADATRIWMNRFIDHAIAKRGMATALSAAIASGEDPYAESRALLTAAVTALLAAGAADGSMRSDRNPDDVLIAISGVALATGEYGNREQATRLLELLLDGLTSGVPATKSQD
jgi:AcrR family transcriptional regulator